ncbi:PEPxxWA-CTERM sorting domain-containing protein [Sphingomonas sp. ID0503]|uniref:PEPxxWA-CTERM sorting domain-containing protein n=1 Tax=Sphingomonas sp. ID0503 TaxID=3399691 RepID=UPI003AFA5279
MTFKALALAAVSLFATAMPAQAAVLFLDSVVQEGEYYRFNYNIRFVEEEGVANGSTVSIFDFDGYVAGSVASTNPLITATTELTSADLPSVPNFNDAADITNLRFTYNGPDLDLSNQTFTGFSALSLYGNVRLDGFSGISIKTAGITAGQTVYTQGPTGVPAVPEASSWAMLIAGFGLVGATARRRRPAFRVAAI